MARVVVDVMPKPEILDPQGQAVESALGHLGFKVGNARIGKVIDVEVDAPDAESARAQVEEMCRQLLANPLMEAFEVEVHG